MVPLSTLWSGHSIIGYFSLNGVEVEILLSKPLPRIDHGAVCPRAVHGPFSTGSGSWVLLESSPTHGSVLRASPDRVVLHFNAILEPSITQVNLVDLQEVLTPLGVTNASTMNSVVAKIPPLQPGVYNVQYKVLATDGHVTEGSIRFTIITR